jgi:hypothetical protein
MRNMQCDTSSVVTAGKRCAQRIANSGVIAQQGEHVRLCCDKQHSHFDIIVSAGPHSTSDKVICFTIGVVALRARLGGGASVIRVTSGAHVVHRVAVSVETNIGLVCHLCLYRTFSEHADVRERTKVRRKATNPALLISTSK